ncbi:MAG: shikimate dehydrogenase, partial [Oscillospiraceae bacterium]|nr:shikimate dehydrogenase [Oscillospiraceae bacterium]
MKNPEKPPVFAVLGHPLGHSLSPFVHKRLFALNRREAAYITADIPPEQLPERFPELLERCAGINVTIPHKRRVIAFLDRLDDSAARYGAVNCIRCTDKTGFNTDAAGFRITLEQAGIPLAGAAAVLGAGGAGRTFAAEAALAGCAVTIVARDKAAGQETADFLEKLNKDQAAGAVEVISFNELEAGNARYDLLINATPVGMYPHAGVSPVSERMIGRCRAVFDAVYNPAQTEL